MLIGANTPVYVAAEAVDMRKSIDGLALLVQESLPVSPLSGSLFVFFNRARDKVKLLCWDRHGFWLAYRKWISGYSHPSHEDAASPKRRITKFQYGRQDQNDKCR